MSEYWKKAVENSDVKWIIQMISRHEDYRDVEPWYVTTHPDYPHMRDMTFNLNHRYLAKFDTRVEADSVCQEEAVKPHNTNFVLQTVALHPNGSVYVA